MKTRVIDIAVPCKTDIDLDYRPDILDHDGLVRRCAVCVTNALKKPNSRYSELQRINLSWMFDALRFTHITIRTMLGQDPKTPSVVDALALARVQLEALYSVCLMVQDSHYVNIYVKSFWRDAFVRFLLEREERKNLPRFDEHLTQRAPRRLEEFQQMAGVTDEEKATIEAEELGTPLPAGMNRVHIGAFPTAGKIIDKITSADQKKMLERLYPEYRRLCAFAHGSAQSALFKGVFWERSPFRQLHSDAERINLFETEILNPALLFSFLSVVQCSCEVSALYPTDVELKATLSEAWSALLKINLLGQTIWEIRARSLLGVVQF